MNTTEEKPSVLARGHGALHALRLVYSGGAVLSPPPTFLPRRGATPIGRDATGGVHLARDSRASRLHATLHAAAPSSLRLVDERSRNGTFVNGRRVDEALLAEGDVVSIGDSYLVVCAEPEAVRDVRLPSLIGGAASMRALRAAVHRVGPTDATVLLVAESGCGKEVVARALHEAGRRSGPFVAVNCSAIPESLAESQLFGHVTGAFSGAVARPGLFRAAHGGTLFLDEVGEMSPSLQPKLLRALQERVVLPVGATEPVACDVRIVAATNRDLEAAVAEQRFRGDLYARLAQFPLTIAPLRARREDVLLLFLHALGAPEPRLTSALAEALLLHAWPFNVRELFALAARLRIQGGGGPVLDLDLWVDRPAVDDREVAPSAAVKEARSEEEKDPPPGRAELEAMLQAHRGVVADVARAMRRSRKQVYRWITHHGLDVKLYRG
jgi:transcriptional regulator with PAS, ATPase and Fis domain